MISGLLPACASDPLRTNSDPIYQLQDDEADEIKDLAKSRELSRQQESGPRKPRIMTSTTIKTRSLFKLEQAVFQIMTRRKKMDSV